jgi:glutamate-1-semialdehyde 2,1-aminomutase
MLPPNIKDGFRTIRSQDLYRRSRSTLIDASSSSSRGPANYGEYPIFMQRGHGSRLFDVDGNEYIDWMMGFGALPWGHADPEITKAIAEGAASGAHFATTTEIELEVAELLQRIIPNAEIVRFANTGTEAVMAAIRLARGFTGRAKILKFEGHYHGWYDDVLVASNPVPIAAIGVPSDPVKIPDSSGLNRHALSDTIVVPWNDLPTLQRAIQNHPGQIAAIITEGVMANMGAIPPADGYLQAVQKLAHENGILFILDETVTGFRIAPGGCQQHYKLNADIVTLGKALGSGLPVAAFAGKAEVMTLLAGGSVLHYGTHNASRIGMHAARANLLKLTRNNSEVFGYIWNLAEELASGMQELFHRARANAIVQRVGPMFQIMFTERPFIRDYREFCQFVDRKKYQRFSLRLFEHGIYTSPAATLHSIVTAAHSREDVQKTLLGMERVLENLT